MIFHEKCALINNRRLYANRTTDCFWFVLCLTYLYRSIFGFDRVIFLNRREENVPLYDDGGQWLFTIIDLYRWEIAEKLQIQLLISP